MTKRKSYNPFKMWGSWIGALIGIYTFIINPLRNSMLDYKECIEITNNILCPQSSLLYFLSPQVLILIFFGFLIGWGIHSLFRRLK